jgi:hypothetical protein
MVHAGERNGAADGTAGCGSDGRAEAICRYEDRLPHPSIEWNSVVRLFN